jgi:hypothetical protein
MMKIVCSTATKEVNAALAQAEYAASSTASNMTILATVECEPHTDRQNGSSNIVTSVNFLSTVFADDFLGPGYRKLSFISHLNGGYIFSKRTKAILVVKISHDNSDTDVECEVWNIFHYLKGLQQRHLTNIPEGLIF